MHINNTYKWEQKSFQLKKCVIEFSVVIENTQT